MKKKTSEKKQFDLEKQSKKWLVKKLKEARQALNIVISVTPPSPNSPSWQWEFHKKAHKALEDK